MQDMAHIMSRYWEKSRLCTYPGLKQLLHKIGLSVQAQEIYPSRVAIDQRGEQIINRDAKTTGKVS